MKHAKCDENEKAIVVKRVSGGKEERKFLVSYSKSQALKENVIGLYSFL